MRFLATLLVVLACAAQSFAVLERLDDGSFVDVDPYKYWFKDEEGKLHVRDPKITDESGADLLLRDDVSRRVEFYLFTRSNPSYLRRQQLYINDDRTLRNSNFDARKPTRFVTHGWTQSSLMEVCTSIRDGYLQEGDYNVILVDWSAISQSIYNYAQARVKLVGANVALMVDFLVRNGMSASTLHLVGHSLGAHVMGLAGHQSTNTIGYIHGLDPAGPGFLLASRGSRIHKDDARFVQIMHTNGGGLGLLASIGDSDYFPNGGTLQSGCAYDLTGVCDHNRSFAYYAESLNSRRGFWARRCSSYTAYTLLWCATNARALMAGATPNVSSTGDYYLDTNWRSPYAQG